MHPFSRRSRPPSLLRIALVASIASSLTGCGAPSSDGPTVAIGGTSQSPTILTPATSSTAEAASRPIPDRIAWLASEEEARAKSKARRLPLLVFLFATWAVPASKMERETWTDARIRLRSSDFVALRLDVSEADSNAQAQADHFDPTAMPSTILLDDLGHEISRIDGYASADDVLVLLGRAPTSSD